MSSVAVATLGLQFDPVLPAVLDKRTSGSLADRPSPERSGPGLLRYETEGTDSTWPKWVYCDKDQQWVELATAATPTPASSSTTVACSASLANSYVGSGNYFLGSPGRSSWTMLMETESGLVQPSSGTFRVPATGVYRLALQVSSQHNTRYASFSNSAFRVHIYQNGSTVITCSENSHTNYNTGINPTSHNTSLHAFAQLTEGDQLSIGVSASSNVRVLGNDVLLNGTVFTMESVDVKVETLLTLATPASYTALAEVPPESSRYTVQQLRIAAPKAEVFAVGNIVADATGQRITVGELFDLRGTESRMQLGDTFYLFRSNGDNTDEIHSTTFVIESITIEGEVPLSIIGIPQTPITSNGNITGQHTVVVAIESADYRAIQANSAAFQSLTVNDVDVGVQLSNLQNTSSDAAIAAALVPYSTTVQTNDIITTALEPYATVVNVEETVSSVLAPYSTTEQVNAARLAILNNYYNSRDTDSAIASALAPYSTTEQVNAARLAVLNNYYNSFDTDSAIASALAPVSARLGSEEVAIGNRSGEVGQNTSAVAIGARAGLFNQGQRGVAIGALAGNVQQGDFSVAIGPGAGQLNQSANSIVVNATTAALNTSNGSGFYIKPIKQGAQINTLHYDPSSGEITYAAAATDLSAYSTTADTDAARLAVLNNYYNAFDTDAAIASALTPYSTTAETDAARLAFLNNYYNAFDTDAAISSALTTFTNDNKVKLGGQAGLSNQGFETIAIGRASGRSNQGNSAIAIGRLTGYADQGENSIAIGNEAGSTSQGRNSIAIGALAAAFGQAANSICLNASNGVLTANVSGLFIKPIRALSAEQILVYNPTSGEITYDTKVLYRAKISAVITSLSGTVVYGSSHGAWTEDLNRTSAAILVDGYKLTAPRAGHYRIVYHTIISSSATVNLNLMKDEAPGTPSGVVSATAYAANNNEVSLTHTDVLYLDAGSFVFVEMNVTNGFLLVPEGTWVTFEEV